MTGKAGAVRAVSQQFKDRTNTVIEGVMAHLRDDNAKEILGPGLSPLIGRGSLKAIVTFALYADVLRMVRDMVMADGEISDEEVQESLGLLSVLAAGFAKVRNKNYAGFERLSSENARQFLSQYESDVGLFGHANEATKWAGVELCSQVQHCCGATEPLENLGKALTGWAKDIAAADGMVIAENSILESVVAMVRQPVQPVEAVKSEQADAQVLDASVATAFSNHEIDDLSPYTAMSEDAALILLESYRALNLGGLRSVSDSLAAVLGRASQDLGLPGVQHLSETAAESLSGVRGKIDLSGLEEMNESLASILARHSGESLYLNGLTSLDEQSAEALSRHAGLVSLDGLASMSADVLRQVSLIRGLSLDGLKSLDSDQAEVLAAVKGSLWLSGITSLGEACAAALSKHRSFLGLDGVTRLSEQAAQSLVTHHGNLSFDLENLPQNIVDILRQHPSLFEVEDIEEDEDVALGTESGDDGTSVTALCFAYSELSGALPIPEALMTWIDKSLVQDEFYAFCENLLDHDGFEGQWQEWMPSYEMPDVFVLPEKDCLLNAGGTRLLFGTPYFCWFSRPRRVEHRIGRRAERSSFVWRSV